MASGSDDEWWKNTYGGGKNCYSFATGEYETGQREYEKNENK
jgi:hypothetical protein